MLRALLLALAFPLALRADPVIHRGVNLGNMLEVPPGQTWNEQLTDDYFPIIHQAGFDTVRVPIDWVDHAGPTPAYAIDPAFFQRVDDVVARANENQLNAILDYHTDPGLMKDPDAHADRFLAIWKQIAEHYATAPDNILFELLNEPNGKLDATHWNALVARVVPEIRQQLGYQSTETGHNDTRTIVVGPVHWNSPGELPGLQLPEGDQHLLVTFHYYDPMQFTHQGASWIEGSQAWLGTKWEGTDAEKAVIARDFHAASAWAQAHHRPLFLGEFGAFSNGDMDSRARWTTCCARTAESLGIGWTYWEFCAGFGAYDPAVKAWRQPLLDALVPPTTN